MLRKFISKVFRRGGAAGTTATGATGKPAARQRKRAPTVLAKAEHGIGNERLSRGARGTCEGLQKAGHQAYVVGGAVRDLLLGVDPKDFDVATDATPEEVHALFRRSRIIGRRFRIVHVMFGAEQVEVSTFRTADLSEAETDAHGRVLRDNTFGSMEDDAARRDFTVNAMYYDPVAETVIDYHGGIADLRARVLRIIGDPEARYREDPVRMLRVTRFAAKLGFSIDPRTRAPIKAMADLLSNVPSSRLFDEMMKLLLSGHAVACVRQLRDEHLHHGLLPLLDVILEQPLGEKFVMLALQRTDERIGMGKGVSPGFLFAALLWHETLSRWNALKDGGAHAMPALYQAMNEAIDTQRDKLAIQNRISADMREIWSLQPRFDRVRDGRGLRTAAKLLEHQRFRAAYDFMLLRAESGEIDRAIADWWTAFIDADDADRAAMLSARPPAAAAGADGAAADGAPKRRRRRRRKSPGDAAPGPAAAD
ncbi:MAG: polynucleotide adenylyltransferase PcnB [Burkholderiales bacterium]|nr:polynucleotide adenylyltransferase PcnB [Burkholderiales bacterium]